MLSPDALSSSSSDLPQNDDCNLPKTQQQNALIDKSHAQLKMIVSEPILGRYTLTGGKFREVFTSEYLHAIDHLRG